MKKGKGTAYMRKRILLIVWTLIGCMVLTGCQMLIKPIQKLKYGKMYGVATSCRVLSIEGSIGATRYVCDNSSDTYIYDKNAVCNYDTGEELVQIEEGMDLLYMACNDEILYYAVSKNNGQLYGYNFETKEKRLITEQYEITGMNACGEDVFISVKEKETEADYSKEHKEKNEILYYHKTEEGISLTEWVMSNIPFDTSEDYTGYMYDEYYILVDHSVEEDAPRIVYIENQDGFRYSCYGYAFHGSNTYNRIEGNEIRLSADGKCRYRGKEEELTVITKDNQNAQGAYAGLSTPFISFRNEEVGIIEQYGKGTPQYQENPDKYYKCLDAFYVYLPETGECHMLYESEDGEQIAGYSYTKNCLYLLTNEGVFEYNLDTGNRSLVFVNDKAYECLCFEYIDNRLYIFSDPFTGENGGAEFLSVVE